MGKLTVPPSVTFECSPSSRSCPLSQLPSRRTSRSSHSIDQSFVFNTSLPYQRTLSNRSFPHQTTQLRPTHYNRPHHHQTPDPLQHQQHDRPSYHANPI